MKEIRLKRFHTVCFHLGLSGIDKTIGIKIRSAFAVDKTDWYKLHLGNFLKLLNLVLVIKMCTLVKSNKDKIFFKMNFLYINLDVSYRIKSTMEIVNKR